MSLRASTAELINRVYPRVTVDAGAELASAAATGSVSQLSGRHVAVVSYRRDGTPVATPVWFAVLDGEVVFRSLAHAHKVRRILHDPRVLVSSCSARGRPTGPPISGRARLLDAASAPAAEQALRGRYSLGRRAYRTATADADAVYVAVTANSGDEEVSALRRTCVSSSGPRPPSAAGVGSRSRPVNPVSGLTAIALVGLVTVEYGGWALLTLLRRAQSPLSNSGAASFRAGHAHAGTLLILALVVALLLDHTAQPPHVQWLVGGTFLLGVMAQSGGFFLHLAVGAPTTPSVGTRLTRLGAVVMGGALLSLAGMLLAAS